MQANDFDDLFARQLGRLPAPDFSERDWREVENRLVIKGLQRKLTVMTWALPLLGAVSLAMAGGLYHQLRQAHREIEELKKTTAAVVRRAAPPATPPRPQAEAFDALTQTVAVPSPATGKVAPDPATTEAPNIVPGDAPLPTAPVPEISRLASNRSIHQPNRVNQSAPASESTPTFSSIKKSRPEEQRLTNPAETEEFTVKRAAPIPERRIPEREPTTPASVPTVQRTTDADLARRTSEKTPPTDQPATRTNVARTYPTPPGTEAPGQFSPPPTGRPVLPPVETGRRTVWGENVAGLKTLPTQSLTLNLDTASYRKPLIAAARLTVFKAAPVETKGEIRRAGQRAPFRLSGLLDATSVGLSVGLPTGWGYGLPAGRGSVLGGQVSVRLTPRWQVFADASSQRVSPESDSPRFLKGIPVVRFQDPDVDVVRFRVNDFSFLNVGAGVNFVVTDRFALKPYVGVGYNLQVPKRYDVSYSFIKRPHRWPPQFPPEKEERTMTLRDRFEPQTIHQFRLQGGVRYPIQPNLNISLEGFLNTQFRRLPTLTDTGGLRVGLAYEF